MNKANITHELHFKFMPPAKEISLTPSLTSPFPTHTHTHTHTHAHTHTITLVFSIKYISNNHKATEKGEFILLNIKSQAVVEA